MNAGRPILFWLPLFARTRGDFRWRSGICIPPFGLILCGAAMRERKEAQRIHSPFWDGLQHIDFIAIVVVVGVRSYTALSAIGLAWTAI